MPLLSFYEQLAFTPPDYMGCFQNFCVFLLFLGLLWNYLNCVAQTVMQDVEHALVWRSLAGSNVTRGEFSSDPRSHQALDTPSECLLTQQLSGSHYLNTKNEGALSKRNSGLFDDPISQYLNDELQYGKNYEFLKESKDVSAAIFFRKKKGKNKKEGDVFQVRMSLYEIEPSICYSVVAPTAITRQSRWNPNCVSCKSIGDGLFRTVLKFEAQNGKAIGQVQSVDQAHILVERDVENYTVAYSSMNIGEDIREREFEWQIPRIYNFYTVYVFSPIMQKKALIGSDITITIKSKFESKHSISKKVMKNLMSEHLLIFAESFENAIRNYKA